ncbi:hypothetical protein JR316_0012921 [Psilocybe cubensis]|uniref:Uncharacterized protein n=2 Tax=Psilocybe cubensis TaxID=181762 RepID=A0ACB8GFY6_PSICU|nr:hypothetical protein JR316_0012921 [Psilocybe cubensis]KAH9474462.1 hypothetical protein JR316_0012921 [Psilocybe cubensis]
MSQTQQIHRRKSSKDEDDIPLPTPPPTVEISVPEEHELPSVTISAPPPRTRTQSTPHQFSHNRNSSISSSTTGSTNPPSAGPFRTSFAPRPLNGHSLPSPYRSSFSAPMPPQLNGHSHSRTRSISTPFSPVSPSPLSSSFPMSSSSPGVSSAGSTIPSNMSVSHSAPESVQQQQADGSQPAPSTTSAATAAAKEKRRHSRMHSRNLSVFFPRPGSIPHSTISEDGSQEVEFGGPQEQEATLIPSAGSSVSIPGSRRSMHQPVTPLGQGFTFGARPPSSLPTPEFMTAPRTSSTSTSSGTSKRGHHHKHSLSHNFFSFLEPGSTGASREEDLHTNPTPTPISPWGPISSSYPDSASATQSKFGLAQTQTHSQTNGHAVHSRLPPHSEPPAISSAAVVAASSQFVLGAWLWVVGQQVGSLACTGLGYWVVFDAFGVALAGVVPGWLASGSGSLKEREKVRRPYGNGRVETVLMFAQAVYLVFSSVYVCKETVEHLLLSAGGGEGHHHHHGDEEEGLGIDFPIIMTFITFISLLGTAIFFENNVKILNITGNRIPSIPSLIRSVWSPSRHNHDPPPTSPVAQIASNPFIASPLFFCVSILAVALFIPPVQHRMADLVLAFIIAALTFKVAYGASTVLGTVLLQTSPPRGLSSGKMESFLRAMREVERHPQVVHLPAPHIWQLTPSYAQSATSHSSSSSLHSPTSTTYKHHAQSQPESLVVTLELHVRHDLGDDDVLKLTRWAWEKCVSAIAPAGSARDYKEMGEEGAPEVTVGVVRG